MVDSLAARFSEGRVRRLSFVSLFVVVASIAAIGGCNRTPSDTPPPAAAASPEQESFDRIVTYMEHVLVGPNRSDSNSIQQFQGNPDGTASSSTGVLSYDMKVEASDEVIPPAEPGAPHRGTITVTMVTSYSRIVKPRDPTKEETKEESNQLSDSSDSRPGTGDEQTTPGSKDKGESEPKVPKQTVRLEPVEEQVEFDLEYVDGKWRLASEEVETRLSAAVESLNEALARQ